MIRSLFFLLFIFSCNYSLKNDSDILLAKVDDEVLKLNKIKEDIDKAKSNFESRKELIIKSQISEDFS